MEAYAFEWLNLLVRWLHVITGIAWIGASFYFVWLDNHLEPPTRDDDIKRDVSGELWAVHGGGFYHAEKFRARPPRYAAEFALVQVGSVLDVDQRLCAAGYCVLRRRRSVFDRPHDC